ncbi:hypothetical protein BDQ17DRAFT_1327465 [Cyathus striatus]|nr:hypothetical protein BDQ17DRAFT_1327465 [Cyathus striatus]
MDFANCKKVARQHPTIPTGFRSTKKAEVARDEGFVRTGVLRNSRLVQYLNPPHAPPEIRIEAAHVLASLVYGTDDSLISLLRARTHQALIYALAHIQPTDPPALAVALARPPLWGLRVHYGRGKERRMSDDEESVVREEVGYTPLAPQHPQHPAPSTHSKPLRILYPHHLPMHSVDNLDIALRARQRGVVGALV